MARDRSFAAELTQPAALVSLGVLVANDHFLKGSGLLPAWLTGKLSDFAGLYLFPVLLFVGISAFLAGRVPRVWRAFSAGLLTAIGFALVKLVHPVNAWVGSFWGEMRMDSSDLIALPMVALAMVALERRVETPRALGWRLVVMLASVMACVATSQPLTRGYPAWKLDDGTQRIGCARFDAWVSKSGKEGVGINVLVEGTGTDRCQVEILSGFIDVGGERVPLSERPRAENLGDVPVRWYLPFAFDNEKAWNDDRRSGTISLDVMTSGGAGRLETAMKHEWGAPHVLRRRSQPDAGSPYALPPKSDQAYELQPKDAGAEE